MRSAIYSDILSSASPDIIEKVRHYADSILQKEYVFLHKKIMPTIKLSEATGNEIEISQVKMTFTQTPDSMDDESDYQELEIFTESAGADEYFIISTKRWSFDNIDEFIMLLNEFKKRL